MASRKRRTPDEIIAAEEERERQQKQRTRDARMRKKREEAAAAAVVGDYVGAAIIRAAQSGDHQEDARAVIEWAVGEMPARGRAARARWRAPWDVASIEGDSAGPVEPAAPGQAKSGWGRLFQGLAAKCAAKRAAAKAEPRVSEPVPEPEPALELVPEPPDPVLALMPPSAVAQAAWDADDATMGGLLGLSGVLSKWVKKQEGEHWNSSVLGREGWVLSDGVMRAPFRDDGRRALLRRLDLARAVRHDGLTEGLLGKIRKSGDGRRWTPEAMVARGWSFKDDLWVSPRAPVEPIATVRHE